MKLLVWGDLAATGFGTVTTDLGQALIDLGMDVHFVSSNEDGHKLEEPFLSRTTVLGGKNGWLGPTPVFSSGREAESWAEFQRERIATLFTGGLGWTPDVTLIIGDPASQMRSNLYTLVPDGLLAFHYVPIEGVRLPPSWALLWQKIQPIALCEFGADQLEALLGIRPPVIYHGVDTESFYPVSSRRPIMMQTKREWLRTKAECKQHLGISPDALVLFRADRFMPRKRFASMLRAAGEVMMKHPNIVLLLHCRTMDEGGHLVDFISHLPPEVAMRIKSTGLHDAGLVADRKLLNVMYNAADIYLSTGAEGFGLTVAESLAAGTPVIAMDYSSLPEVVGDAGVLTPMGYYVENEYAYLWANVDERKYAEALDALVMDARRRALLGAKGPAQVRKFSWSKAAEQVAELCAAREAVAA